eukprot:sb/3462558/
MLQSPEDEDEITDDGPMKTRRGGRKTGHARVTLEVFDELLQRVIGNWYLPRTGFETDPFYEIMIVCIMFLREDLAVLMWSRTRQPLKAALAALYVTYQLKKCATYAIGSDEKVIIKALHRRFEEVAVGTINEAYLDDPKVCIISMNVPWERFNNCSLLNIAWGAHSKAVLGTRPAQEILNKRWRGGIRRHVAFFKTFFVSLFPLLLVFREIIPFRPHVLYQTQNKEAERISKRTNSLPREGFDGWVTRVKEFYNSPYIKFQNHAFFYILFLVLHIYVTLFKLKKKWEMDWSMGVLFGMVILYVVEELREILTTDHRFRQSYLESVWNRIDVVMYLLYLISLTCFFGGISYDLSRVLLCTNTLVLFTRLLFVCNAIPELGTLLLILREMTNDLFNIALLMLIICLGYGVALMGVLVDPAYFATHNLFGIFFFPYFQIFGEMHFDELVNATKTINGEEKSVYLASTEELAELGEYLPLLHVMPPVRNQGEGTDINFIRVTSILLMAVFMIIVAVGFINLLIAMFSDTYRRIKDDQLSVWKYMRFGICIDYETANITPPLSILFYIAYFIHWIFGRLCRGPPPAKDPEQAENESRIMRWKDHVLVSLMKEASISYLRKKGLFEMNIRKAMADSRTYTDQVAMLNLQNRMLKAKQLKLKKNSTLSKIRFRSKSRAAPPGSRKQSVAVSQSGRSWGGWIKAMRGGEKHSEPNVNV